MSRKAAADAPAIERMTALAAQISALWLSTHSHLPGPRRISDEPWVSVATVASDAIADAARAAEETRRCGSAAATGFIRAEPGWSYDFVFDRCANEQQLKCLTVTDEFTKEGLAIEVDALRTVAKVRLSAMIMICRVICVRDLLSRPDRPQTCEAEFPPLRLGAPSP